MTKILSLDTTAKHLSCAILSNGEILDKYIFKGEKSHAEQIIHLIEFILARNYLNYNNINYFTTIIGPASFIRMRIGIAALYGIRFALKKEIIGCNLFNVYRFYLQNYQDTLAIHAYGNVFYLQTSNKEQFTINRSKIDFNNNSYNNEKFILCGANLFNEDNISTILAKFVYTKLCSGYKFKDSVEPIYLEVE